ncbi:MAG: adenylosuccinate synthase [Candidatus Hydrogenedentes bacterium]|nr:adenylosuccinate synthase [Candidatus Hydrogenedentota bacterium]
MPGIVITGMQWGDEGKGKIVDYITRGADMVVRHQGGNNAGHTVVVNGEQTVLHIVPSGILHPAAINVIGNGTVIDPAVLIGELDGLAAAGVSVDGRLFISDCAHVIMPHHKALDVAQEKFRGKNRIGTTGRGIGPAYADKADRSGIRIGDLIEPKRFAARLETVLAYKNAVLQNAFGEAAQDFQTVYDEYAAYGERLKPYVADTVALVHEAVAGDKKIVFEGAQGCMLDIDHGTFPYVTSSTTLSSGACTGAGVGPKAIGGVIGIVKAYTTRVGEGPFPTELLDATGEELRARGHEYGATTGRPRRCGWLDCVQLRRAVMLNGATGIALTKPDVLDTFGCIKVCVSYRVGGKETRDFPTQLEDLAAVEPVFEEHPGWNESIAGCRTWDELPVNAQRYFDRIAALLDVPIAIVSVGPGREQTIVCQEPF